MNSPELFMQTKLSNRLDHYETEISELTASANSISKRLKYFRDLILNSQQKNVDEEIQQINNNIDQTNSKITEIQNSLTPLTTYSFSSSNPTQDTNQSENANEIKNPVHLSPNFNCGGILNFLITSQTSIFNRLVVPSQSSGDIYSIIDKNDSGNYSSGSGEYEWIQFEFPEEITFTSFTIQSAHRSFLKTWNIIGYDSKDEEVLLFEAKNDESLNGKYNTITKLFLKKFKTKKLRLEKFGENWSNTNFFRIMHIDFFSDDPRFQGKGVFEQFIEEAPDKDAHKSMVYVTASNFDFRFYHQIDPKRSICTLYDDSFPWFQIELASGSVVISGYRLIQNSNFPLTNWTVEGSNDKTQWELIHHQVFEDDFMVNTFFFIRGSNKPFKYIRIVNRQCDGDETMKLRFRHFDIFGTFYPNGCPLPLCDESTQQPVMTETLFFQESDDENSQRNVLKRMESKRFSRRSDSSSESSSSSSYYSTSEEEEEDYDEEDYFEYDNYYDQFSPEYSQPF